MGSDASRGSSLVTLADAGRYGAVFIGGAAVGLLAGWLVVPWDLGLFDLPYDLPLEVVLAVVVWLATVVYLSTKDLTSGVVGSTLYFVAALVVLKPLVLYAPVIRTALASTGHQQSQLLLEGLGGLLAWGLPAGVLALVFVAVGRRAKVRARQIRMRRARVAIQEET